MRSRSVSTAVGGLILLFGVHAGAVPTTVTSIDTGFCDVLSVPTNVEELGGMGGIVLPSQPALPTAFPVGERIMTGALGSSPNVTACGAAGGILDSAAIPNQRVAIVNLNAVAYSDVWYVADLQTFLTNVDGGVASGGGATLAAFKIDAIGNNTPLIAESILADGIFAPGEMWTFVLQDWSNNLLAAPHAFNQIGVATTSGVVAPNLSTGSIIAVPVPEPGTGLLVLAGLLGFAGRRKATA